MRKLIQNFLLAGVFAATLQSALAFTPDGPASADASWQTVGFGFNPLSPENPSPVADAVPTYPKNIGQAYRPNLPVQYYTFDQTFMDFFGSDGTNAVNGAFAILNGLTNVDSYSTGLTEFPLDSSSINYQAQALDLIDLKSLTLAGLMPYLGLDDSIRYTWVVHSRWHIGSVACPVGENYLVTERNFDISPTSTGQFQFTPYVNDALYTYAIWETCGLNPNPYPTITAMTVITPSDALVDNPPVASGSGYGQLFFGGFYTGLTRDDVAGLRYLLKASNAVTESPAAGSLLMNTGSGAQQALYTSDLGSLIAASQVVDPVTLEGLFPGVLVDFNNSSYYVTNEVTYPVITYITNLTGSASGTPVLYTGVSKTPVINIVTNYSTSFLNVITNTYYTKIKVSVMTVSNFPTVGSASGSPLQLRTNYTSLTITNYPSGDYYIIPPGICGWSILYPLATNVVATTYGNPLSVSNAYGYVYSQSVIVYATNHVYVVQPINCGGVTPPAAQYEGIERMQFVYVDPRNYDTAAGQFITPITNNYTMSEVTSTNVGGTIKNIVVIQKFQRILTTPDFQFSAADLVTAAGDGGTIAIKTPAWNEANVLPGLAGPGTMDTGAQITFNNVGALVGNSQPGTTGSSGLTIFNYASFDGSTNDPIVYPNGTSISDLQNQVFIQIFPSVLPDATNNVAYSSTFTVSGGTSPYSWSLAVGSVLPSGMTLSSGGTLSGIPTQIGTFDFVVQMTDSATTPHVVQENYTLTIH